MKTIFFLATVLLALAAIYGCGVCLPCRSCGDRAGGHGGGGCDEGANMTFDEILAKANAGEYKSKLPYPQSPPKKAPYNEHMAHRNALHVRQVDENRLDAMFWADVALSIGADEDDEFFVKMSRLAWASGHSNGYSEVLIQFQELVPLWELYKGKKKGRKK